LRPPCEMSPMQVMTEAVNVVTVVLDCVRADHLSGYGYSPASPRVRSIYDIQLTRLQVYTSRRVRGRKRSDPQRRHPMKRMFRGDTLSVLCGVALASLLGTGMAHAFELVVTNRTLAGPGSVTGDCGDSTPRPVYRTGGAKVCVTVQNNSAVGCDVTVDVVDYHGNSVYSPSPVLKAGESATLCGSKVATINTTPSGTGTASYQWRVDY
jgi:hypothetical protein